MSKVIFALVMLAAAAFPAGAAQPLSNIDSVAIDFGHGADDAGSARGDALEKSQCALVAQALKGVIERENGAAVRVVFTAKPDGASAQRDRAYAANSNGAKLFLSIHGFPARQSEAGIYISLPLDEATPSWKNTTGKFFQKSGALAEKLRASLSDANLGRKFFIGFAPLRSFYGVVSPAVAIEAVPIDPQHPLTPEAAETIARAVYSGVVEYGKIP
jgi:N-acetylmuramoyl-L-alanine amidase